jgi:hypothetical protein
MDYIADAFGYHKNGRNAKDAKSLKTALVMTAYENESANVIKFFGFDNELKTLEKEKLTELKKAVAKKEVPGDEGKAKKKKA